MSLLPPSILFFHLPTLGKIIRLHFGKYFTWRRFFISILLFIPFTLFISVVLVGRILDELLFFGYRQMDLSNALFIISNPRSGTTYMHRLLCLDTERHQYMKLYQTLLPSVTLIVIIQGIAIVDGWVGGPLKWCVEKLSDKLFGGWKDIHPMGFNMAEEDEGMFVYSLLTPGIFLMFPFIDEFDYVQFCDNLPEKSRKRLMKYYATSLQRFMFATGQNKVLVSKNVLSTGRLASLLETLDGIKIVYIIREPYKAVPSLVNMFYVVWKFHSPEIASDSEFPKQFAQLGMKYYQYFHEVFQKIPPKQLRVVRYADFIANPVATVEDIYAYFELPVSESFKQRLYSFKQANKSYKSKHSYSLEMFGLSREEVYQELKEIFEIYGFDSGLEHSPIPVEDISAKSA